MSMFKIVEYETQQEWLNLRSKVISSTESAALFGLSKYVTEFELWYRKKNELVSSIEETERMFWGSILEPAIAAGIAKKNGWTIQEKKHFIADHELRIGASFDFEVTSPEPAILEIKNVDSMVFKSEWTEVDAPLHIEMQVQHQLMASGLNKAYIGALVGGNDLYVIERLADPVIHEKIKARIAKFWKSINDNTPPSPNFERDADFISRLYNHAEPGKVMDADDIIKGAADMYKQASEKIKHYTDIRDAAKAKILERMKDAEKIKDEKFTISAGVVGPAQIAYERAGYRSFRISWKKEQK